MHLKIGKSQYLVLVHALDLQAVMAGRYRLNTPSSARTTGLVVFMRSATAMRRPSIACPTAQCCSFKIGGFHEAIPVQRRRTCHQATPFTALHPGLVSVDRHFSFERRGRQTAQDQEIGREVNRQVHSQSAQRLNQLPFSKNRSLFSRTARGGII